MSIKILSGSDLILILKATQRSIEQPSVGWDGSPQPQLVGPPQLTLQGPINRLLSLDVGVQPKTLQAILRA